MHISCLENINWVLILQLISGITTPVIAGLAVVIALGQYRVNRLQHRLALFEKRMAIYNETKAVIALVIQKGDCEFGEFQEFDRKTRDNVFLFGPEIQTYLNEVFHQGKKLAYDAKLVGKEGLRTELLTWFHGQSQGATNKFAPYMDFRKP